METRARNVILFHFYRYILRSCSVVAMPSWFVGPGVTRGARRGPYRKARRGASAPNRRRLKRRLTEAMAAYGGPGKWVVRKVSANHYALQRVDLDAPTVLRDQFTRAPSPVFSVVPLLPLSPLHTLLRPPFRPSSLSKFFYLSSPNLLVTALSEGLQR